MKKLILTLLCGALITSTFAQMPYAITTLPQPYVKLTNDMAILHDVWHDFLTTPPLPAGFNFKINNVAVTAFNLFNDGSTDNMFGFTTDYSSATHPGFVINGGLVDRDYPNLGASVGFSPITYVVTNTAGGKIFKAQFFNAGFRKEFDTYGTLNDSINLQIWLYDSSNIVEIHFGDSKISHASTYFNAAAPIIGYTPDYSVTDNQRLYYLKGQSTTATIDSALMGAFPTSGLTEIPASGVVYRFTPVANGNQTSVRPIAGNIATSVYPTLCTGKLNIDCNTNATYEVSSIAGVRTKLQGNLQKGTNDLDINSLPAGMYLICMHNEESWETIKFIKIAR